MVDSGTSITGTTSDLTVVHAFHNWLPTTQSWMYNQVRHLPDDIDVHIVCEETSNLEEFHMPNIHHPGDSRLKVLLEGRLRTSQHAGRSRLLHRVIRDTAGQIVHSHFGPTGLQNAPVTRRMDVKHVVTFYGYDVTMWPRNNSERLDQYQALFRDVDRVFCEGPAMAHAVAGLGCEPDKITVQHLGVPLDRLPYRPRTWSPREPLRVLMVASFREKKGLPFGIKALSAISSQVDLQVTIIGDAANDAAGLEEKERITRAIDEAGLRNRVTMMGFQPYSTTLQAGYEHHILLAPSLTALSGDTEGGAPVIIAEMAASGMPIVSSLHCDIPEVIIDGKTGWLSPEKDVDAIAAHIEWLIRHPDEWSDYLAAGRAHIETEYDCVKQGVRLAAHYREIVGPPASLP